MLIWQAMDFDEGDRQAALLEEARRVHSGAGDSKAEAGLSEGEEGMEEDDEREAGSRSSHAHSPGAKNYGWPGATRRAEGDFSVQFRTKLQMSDGVDRFLWRNIGLITRIFYGTLDAEQPFGEYECPYGFLAALVICASGLNWSPASYYCWPPL